jgi:ribonuclease Z
MGPTRSAPTIPDTGLHAVLLGTGIPVPNPDRANAATLIVAGGKTFMVDTGPGSVSRLAENGYRQVDYVLFTHFHLDHYGDLDRVLFSRGAAGADHPQPIFGPKGTKDVVDKVVASVAIDEQYRIVHHGEHWSDQAMHAAVQEFEPGVIFDEDGIKITMFNVNHEPVLPAVGYRFDYEGKSIVVSGDTKKSDSLIAAAQDCDLLIHEAMNATVLNRALPGLKRVQPRGGAMLEDLMSHHTPALEVAEVAKEANVKKLVLTHLVPSIAPLDAPEKAFVRGMSDIYTGPIVVGQDNMIFTVE